MARRAPLCITRKFSVANQFGRSCIYSKFSHAVLGVLKNIIKTPTSLLQSMLSLRRKSDKNLSTTVPIFSMMFDRPFSKTIFCKTTQMCNLVPCCTPGPSSLSLYCVSSFIMLYLHKNDASARVGINQRHHKLYHCAHRRHSRQTHIQSI